MMAVCSELTNLTVEQAPRLVPHLSIKDLPSSRFTLGQFPKTHTHTHTHTQEAMTNNSYYGLPESLPHYLIRQPIVSGWHSFSTATFLGWLVLKRHLTRGNRVHCIHIHTHTHMTWFIYIYIYIYVCVCVCVCVCVLTFGTLKVKQLARYQKWTLPFDHYVGWILRKTLPLLGCHLGGVCVPQWSQEPTCLVLYGPGRASHGKRVLGEGPDKA